MAAALAALGLCELFIRSLNADFHGPRWLNVIAVLLIAAPITLRRQAPLAALVVYWIPAQIWLDVVYGSHSNLPIEPFLVLLILVFTAASLLDGRQHLVVLAVLGGLYASELALLVVGRKGLGNVVPGLVFISLAYVLGRGVHRRRSREASLQQRTVVLEQERETVAHQAVRDERDRIARELHDVIAHSVSVIIVQAGAAQRLLERDTRAAERALETIRTAGSEALDELRRLLDLMHDAPGADSEEPQPGVARLDNLIAQARETGLPVELTVDGSQRPLAPGVDLAVYRIVQEALTNIRKHAGPANARVQLHFSPNQLELSVLDDGRGNGRPANGRGHGLIGMRERVALYGGTLASGPRSTGGFEVRATIPLHRAPA
jgi:signal transduction histidine kinase